MVCGRADIEVLVIFPKTSSNLSGSMCFPARMSALGESMREANQTNIYEIEANQTDKQNDSIGQTDKSLCLCPFVQ